MSDNKDLKNLDEIAVIELSIEVKNETCSTIRDVACYFFIFNIKNF